jgi:hypothetical protein
MLNQSEEAYKWALQELKELYNQIQLTANLTASPTANPTTSLNTSPTASPSPIRPSAISTDCDQALRNALSIIFLETQTLLCL